ncbi:hypothetical protein [Candidatus Tisiphia endosymbiont of Piscicola geometra]|uniref:hypothetical protein n=1 Tax=Candidatus Tisiphia endosymbiont of Piscicola geometra TaxID=3066273 RepID=UPI00312C8133
MKLELIHNLLFNTNADVLTKSIEELNKLQEGEHPLQQQQLSNILSYCLQYNPNLTKELVINVIGQEASSRQIITKSDADITTEFYKQEAKYNFFGFTSSEEFEQQLNTVNLSQKENMLRKSLEYHEKIIANKQQIANLKIDDKEFTKFQQDNVSLNDQDITQRIKKITQESKPKRPSSQEKKDLEQQQNIIQEQIDFCEKDAGQQKEAIEKINEQIKNLKQKIVNSDAKRLEHLVNQEKILENKKDSLEQIAGRLKLQNTEQSNILVELNNKLNEVKDKLAASSIKPSSQTNSELSCLKKMKFERETTSLEQKLQTLEMQQVVRLSRHEVARKQFIEAFKFSKLVADHVEQNNTFNNNLVNKHAYDMVVCFGGNVEKQNNAIIPQDIVTVFNNFLHDKGLDKVRKPVHDSFSTFHLPQDGKNITLDAWQSLIKVSGKKAMNLFASADKIELKKAELMNREGHIPPITIDDAIEIRSQITYKRATEYKELAALCDQYRLSEDTFNKCLQVAPKRKTKDNLPNIVISGDKIQQTDNSTQVNTKGYHLVKLPIDDPRAYILGNITNCCQSIGGNSEKCVIDGITKENNGFYVLLKDKNTKISGKPINAKGKIDYNHYDIVGQGYAWLSKEGNFTFDSWENLRNKESGNLRDDAVVVPMLQEFAKQVTQDNKVSRVTIGTGGKTPEYFKTANTTSREFMLEGYDYGDADCQSVVGQSIQLTELQEELKVYLAEQTNQIISINQGKETKRIISILKEGKTILTTEKNQVLTSNNAMTAYKEQYIAFDELKDLEVEKIKALTSQAAMTAYKEKYITFDELKDLEAKKIEYLTSYDAHEVYKGYVTFDQLKGLEAEKIKALISYDAHEVYKRYVTFDQLKSLEVEKIKALTSSDAHEVYKRYVTFDQLKGLEVEKIKALTSSDAHEVYKEYVTFDQLKGLEVEKIKALTSSDAQFMYGKKYVKKTWSGQQFYYGNTYATFD